MSAPSPRPLLPWPQAVVRTWGYGWLAAVHLVCDLLLAGPYLALAVLLVTAVCLVPVVAVGIPMLFALLWLGLPIAAFERLRIAAATGRPVPAPPQPAGLSGWRRWFLDGRTWRAQGHVALLSLWGLTGGLLMAVLLGVAVALIAVPLYLPWLTDGRLAVPFTAGIPAGAATWSIGLLLLAVLPLVAQVMVGVDVALAQWLIGPGRDAQVEQLTERVHELTETRAAVVQAGEAERRRIERDLHDGPQQRLVSIAMDLGMARAKLDSEDYPAARELLAKAHTSSKEAIVDLRHVVRGIHPPVLTDRGLDAALSALAARSPVPVDVRVDLARRPDPTIEAIAYFCVSEALTNIAKHAGATGARVVVDAPAPFGPSGGRRAQVLRIDVSDDGRGGADPVRGTGLTGLQQRLAAVDGSLRIDSPPAGGTRLVMELPMGEGV